MNNEFRMMNVKNIQRLCGNKKHEIRNMKYDSCLLKFYL